MEAKQLKAKAAQSAGRGRPPAETSQKRMKHLLEVARRIFVQRGYRATTMDEVAAAAGLTKRTLYAWHRDKEMLFRACVLNGAERFPHIEPDGLVDVSSALKHYVVELHNELAREDSYGMGMLFAGAAADFPELADIMTRGLIDYLVQPLSVFLRRHGLEEEGSVARTLLFVSMALSPLHYFMLVGMPLPRPPEVTAHAQLCVDVFLEGNRVKKRRD